VLNFGPVETVSVSASSLIIRFSAFEVNLHTGELRKRGQKVKLQEQPFQVLAALLERPGELVTREELRSKLWPADTFVDFDHSLNAAIKRLREALGESAETPIFVETVARRGYRFIGNIGISAATPSAPPRPWQRSFTRNALVIGLAVCALALFVVYYRHSRRSKAGQPTVISVVTEVGEKYTPSLSPDGQHLAFAWNGGSGSNFNIYVKLVGTEEPVRLTKQASIDFDPVWSPDGRYISFCRIQKDGTGIYIIPSLGGAERRLRETLWEGWMDEILWSAGRLSWSPDGKLLAYSDRASNREAASIFLLSLDSLDVRRLTSLQHSGGDANPAFSPDGQTLAFTRASQEWQGFQAIYTVPVSGGEEQRLVSDITHVWGLAWTPDSRHIVFADAGWLVSPGWLWEIPVHGTEPERLLFGQEGIQPSIRGNRLVYVRQMRHFNVWRRELNSLRSASPPDSFLSSTKMDSGPQFSPDGSKITFESTRSGTYEVWMCRSDGSGLIQLTHFNAVSGTPRWSPDGQQIAFDSRPAGNADIFVIDSKGGRPRKLTDEPSNEVVPSWSQDGRSIYFASDRTGGWEIWKMPSAGGPAVQVTHHGGFASFESPDGAFLYYAKGLKVPGLWRIPTNGGEEVEVISSLGAGYWGYWTVVDNGIYYLDPTTKFGINFFDVATHRTTRLFDLGKRPARQVPGLAVSPDKKTILYTQLDALSNDIILVDDFR
jgi:Tol biopolymer transport system component/DNA-binding winged helix-turn-helix (wHTH) protein